MQQGPNLWKWGFLSLVGVVGFLVLGVIALAMIGAQTPGPPAQEDSHNGPHKAAQSEPQPSESKSQVEAEPRIVPKENIVERDVNAYYDAAAAGDYGTTYSLLAQSDRDYYTREAWIEANTIGGSDQATYELTDVRQVSENTYDVDILVSGTPRTTQFVNEDGLWVHDLTAEEVAMFDNNLASSSASASASVSPSPEQPSSTKEYDSYLEVSGTSGIQFSCAVMDGDMNQRTVDGTTPTNIKLSDMDGLMATSSNSCQKMGTSGTLKVSIVVDGNTEASNETSAQYGVVTVSYPQ
ncbi:MAG: hypothetical protein WKF53_07560 [Rubrobacter sp.]